MISPYHNKVKKRTMLVFFLLLLWICVIIFRLTQFQIIEHSQFESKILDQNQNIESINPKRGNIYDRNGVILAISLPRKSVAYTASKDESIASQMQKIQKLKRPLGLTTNEVQRIGERIKNNEGFIWVKRKINQSQVQLVKKLSLRGIHMLEENKRFYPHGDLASHIIGNVNIDDDGASGIEYEYNSILKGELGKGLILVDARKREYRFDTLQAPVPGQDIYLTIDETIQHMTERVLEKAVKESQANWGIVVISNPATGEILATANVPSFDPNTPPPFTSDLNRNRAIQHIFDPGSTFKIITATAALESGSVDLDQIFDCSEGTVYIAGKTISDHHRFELLTFPEVIIHSSNVGTIKISQLIGEKALYETIKRFGFGQKTGIDLPGEEKGIFRNVSNWTTISSASLSIGYEISVTAIQMLQALNIIINDGALIPFRLTKKTPGHDDHNSLVSPHTAQTLKSILKKAVEEGTGLPAQIKGFPAAGKTGTAQRYLPSIRGYSSSSHRALFLGYTPADNPTLSMIVVIDDPKGLYYGGQVAAPIFKEIAYQVLRYLKISPKMEELQPLITAKKWSPTGE
jgi:cell division protein FtsI (penicillin-binding protein 3)